MSQDINVLTYEIQDAETKAMLLTDTEYEAKEALKPVSERWVAPTWFKMARALYGSEAGKICFVVGSGPSKNKAAKYLTDPPPGVFTIAINAAIKSFPAKYWFFLDGISYGASKDHPNVATTNILACHRFWRFYGTPPDNMYLWERAHTTTDIKAGKIVNHATSFIGALHMAAWLGAVRVVTIGCENRLQDVYNLKEYRIGTVLMEREKYVRIQRFTYQRIAQSLTQCTKFWKPSWMTLADASTDGELPLPKTTVNYELDHVLPKAKEKYGELWQPSATSGLILKSS